MWFKSYWIQGSPCVNYYITCCASLYVHDVLAKGAQHTSMVRSMNKRRWLHLPVNSQHYKLLMGLKRKFPDKWLVVKHLTNMTNLRRNNLGKTRKLIYLCTTTKFYKQIKKFANHATISFIDNTNIRTSWWVSTCNLIQFDHIKHWNSNTYELFPLKYNQTVNDKVLT